MKSAYEIALERLAEHGVSPPSPDAVSAELRHKIDEIRTRADASLAELEILHRDRLRKISVPDERADEEETYLHERRRIEGDRDRELARLRSKG